MAFYDSIKLEKGMYHNGLTKTLETLDPSENYLGTELAGLDAYQRQLKRFDLKVSGSSSDIVDKFFKSPDCSVLFPEYIKRAVKQGISENNKLPEIVATTTKIQGMDYRTISSDPVDEVSVVGEAEPLTETAIRTQKNLVSLKKRGRALTASYEALRYQRLDLLTVVLKHIGSCIARSLLGDAVEVLLNGDGNSNPAEQSNTSITLNYNEILKLWAGLLPYELNTLMANTETIQKILSLKEMKDSTAGLNFQATGKLITPIGATLIPVPSLDSDIILGLDKTCALEMIKAGELVVDSDKIIDRQLEGAGISCTVGFAKIFPAATKKLCTK
jgi:hypothetical protein